MAAKTKSPSSAPVVRRPRSKLTGRNPRPVTPAELGLPCGTSPEIVAAAVAGLEAGAAEPPQSYDQQSAISPREYDSLQRAYDFFGPGLFGLALPDVFFTYTPRSHSGGHYAHQRYAIRADGSKRSGLALNPDAFIGRDDRWIASVFVHEMAHVWQFAHGKPSGSYHNMQWAEKMESIGLMPSNTGAVGGKRTGAKMSHYIIKGGPFDRLSTSLKRPVGGLRWSRRRFARTPRRSARARASFVARRPARSFAASRAPTPTAARAAGRSWKHWA